MTFLHDAWGHTRATPGTVKWRRLVWLRTRLFEDCPSVPRMDVHAAVGNGKSGRLMQDLLTIAHRGVSGGPCQL